MDSAAGEGGSSNRRNASWAKEHPVSPWYSGLGNSHWEIVFLGFFLVLSSTLLICNINNGREACPKRFLNMREIEYLV